MKTLPPTINPTANDPQVQSVWVLLPQTQCKRCGFEDCEAYAHAIVHEQTPINQCPPGGEEGVRRLSKVTSQSVVPLNPVHGAEGPRHVAFVDESWCIGCTLCLDACPTDAIVGTHKSMHTVLEQFCTGCELCLPVCPVDCIELQEVSAPKTGWQAWSEEEASTALERYQKRLKRLLANTHATPRTHTQAKRLQLTAQQSSLPPVPSPNTSESSSKPLQSVGEDGLTRLNEQKENSPGTQSNTLTATLLAQALERAKRLRS